MKAKRNRQFPPRTMSQVSATEPSPFSDMFGTPEDIFADVLVGDDSRDFRENRENRDNRGSR